MSGVAIGVCLRAWRPSERLILADPVPGDFSLVDQRQRTRVAFKGMFLARWPNERKCTW